jgi:hypothetical protein
VKRYILPALALLLILAFSPWFWLVTLGLGLLVFGTLLLIEMVF